MNENYYIGKNIKTLREKFDLSQEQLASKLNVSSQAVSKWETADSYPSIETMVKLSKIFYTSVDALITNMNTYEELDSSARNLNFRLRQMWYRYNRNESISGELNDIVAIIIPLYNNEKEHFWIYSARVILKGTIYAMLEDKNINDDRFNLETLKEILQFSNLDNEDKRNKIADYFKDKSDKCKEMLSVYLTTALGTATSFMSYVLVHVNMLTN